MDTRTLNGFDGPSHGIPLPAIWPVFPVGTWRRCGINPGKCGISGADYSSICMDGLELGTCFVCPRWNLDRSSPPFFPLSYCMSCDDRVICRGDQQYGDGETSVARNAASRDLLR